MNSAALYRARILPALRRIQHEYGYLKAEELEAFSRKSGIPLYRLEAVASFFPHFRLTPPPTLTVRVCRDTSCHLAGADRVLDELKKLAGGGFRIEGVSCLGRCDRAPAAHVELCRTAVTQQPHEGDAGAPQGSAAASPHRVDDERFYLGRAAPDLAKYLAAVVKRCADGSSSLPKSELDIDLASSTPDERYTDGGAPAEESLPEAPRGGKGRYPAADWVIDPYTGKARRYAAVDKAIGAIRTSLGRAAEKLRAQMGWSLERAELFSAALTFGQLTDISRDREMQDAIRAWQTEDAWAKGPDIGGWADALLDELDKKSASGGKEAKIPDLLRGMGGAGIPAAQKWRDVRDAVRAGRRRRTDDDRAFIVVNADESEPATFKDRELLLHYPHLVIEGVILAGLITDASQGFIYIRHEYPEQIEACRREIERAQARGVFQRVAAARGRPFPVEVFVSPGGYICGEQSALIEAMSDRRAEPRNMPPKLETNGLDDRPTLVSNVETFAWVPFILINGGDVCANLGVNGWRGRRFFSVSGDVNRPGVYEVPMGMTVRELIEGNLYCQGIVRGKKLKAFAPSGPSGGFLPAKLKAGAGLPRKHTENKVWQALAKRRGFDPAATELDVLDLELELEMFRALSPTQALGAGLVVYAEGRDMADQSVNAIQFFRNESCGKCVPCRIGSQKLAAVGKELLAGNIASDDWGDVLSAVSELLPVISVASICGLGRSVPVPFDTAVKFFPEDIARHMGGGVKAAVQEPKV